MENLRQTALYDLHVQLDARIVDFGGWAMPVQYSGIIDEHLAVRGAAGLFDVSHMGEIRVTGPDAEMYLQALLTNDVTKVASGQCQYTLMCNELGGCIDDVLVYRFAPDNFLVVVNAANVAKDMAWMHKQAAALDYSPKISDETPNWSLLALQGPKAEAILSKLTNFDLTAVPFFTFATEVHIADVSCVVSRTGYTGEDGFEIFCAWEDGPRLWEAIMAAGESHGIMPCGLGARDTLRLEARLPLYGQELDEETTPLEAGLGMFVKLEKGSFVGRGPLQQQKESGLRKRLVGFEIVGRGIPRTGYEIQHEGKAVGIVTSGTMSPSLEKYLGLGFVPPELANPGHEIDIMIRGRQVAAETVRTPFYRRHQTAK